MRKEKAKIEHFGVKALDFSDEFAPRIYRAKVFSLREFGIPQVPVIGRTDYRQVD